MSSSKPGNWFLLIISHLFFGFGLFYIDRKIKRKWIYPIFAIYAWFSLANVFLRIFDSMAWFHNNSAFGILSIFIALGVTYVIGYIDVILTYKKRISIGND